MRNLDTLCQYAVPGLQSQDGGAFIVPSCEDQKALHVIASHGLGWDHVSVSRGDRAPTWAEMSQIHRMFFRTLETAMQLHVPEADHINIHPRCLHLWRPQGAKIRLPPPKLV